MGISSPVCMISGMVIHYCCVLLPKSCGILIYPRKVIAMEAVFSDPLLPAYWFDKPLYYTNHAKERCMEREIQELDFLPISAKLVDCDKDKSGRVCAVCFKVDSFYIVISVDGAVVTVFNNENKGMKRYNHRKNERRFYTKKLISYFGDENHKLISSKKFK